jgi:hypothetical protein
MVASVMLDYRQRVDNHPKRKITRKTINAMHNFAKSAKQDWAWVHLITWIVRDCPNKDYHCEAKTLFQRFHDLIWRQRYWRYIRDPRGVELVESPWHVMDRRASDCDGWAAFIASAWGAIGARYRFKTINADPDRPSEPSHVYTQVLLRPGGWVSGDLTVPEATFGWEPEGLPFKVWPEPNY